MIRSLIEQGNLPQHWWAIAPGPRSFHHITLPKYLTVAWASWNLFGLCQQGLCQVAVPIFSLSPSTIFRKKRFFLLIVFFSTYRPRLLFSTPVVSTVWLSVWGSNHADAGLSFHDPVTVWLDKHWKTYDPHLFIFFCSSSRYMSMQIFLPNRQVSWFHRYTFEG